MNVDDNPFDEPLWDIDARDPRWCEKIEDALRAAHASKLPYMTVRTEAIARLLREAKAHDGSGTSAR